MSGSENTEQKPQNHRVLVVDDNPENIQIVAALLSDAKLSVAFATDGASAVALCRENLYSAVLLDIMMPGMDGFETCRRIKARPEYRDIPVIFLTAKQDKESVVHGFEVGGVDYITKPIFGPELITRLETQLRFRDQQLQLEDMNVRLNKEVLKAMQIEDQLRESERRLRETNTRLEELATTDALTGLLNRREIERHLIDETRRHDRGGEGFSVILCDIDHFKQVNDSYGHDCGDETITTISELLRSGTRAVDRVSRWGGEEFLLLLPDTNLEGAMAVAEKLRQASENMQMSCEGSSFTVTLTLGVARRREGVTIDALLRQVDVALYEGKRAGRNRVAAAE